MLHDPEILEFQVVKSTKYFRRLNNFLKFVHVILLTLRVMGSYGALAAGFFCIVFLQQQLVTPENPWRQSCEQEKQKIPLIIVDAGHGGHDGGAVANGAIEKHLTLEIARKVREELVAAGFRVVMTRDGDVFLPLEERAVLSEKLGAEVFVSVHINTDGSGSEAEGLETYFAGKPSLLAIRKTGRKEGKDSMSEKLASLVQRCACEETQAVNRGTKQRDYVVIEEARCPAVLVECGFLTNAIEARRLREKAHQEKLATGIASGVKLFLKSKPTPAAVLAEK